MGWPNVPGDTIIKNMPKMWKALEVQGLTEDLERKGFGYKKFVEIALMKKREADMIRSYHTKFEDLFRK